ncbi:MAG TPA: hypothetical protein VNK43_03240 [Gemmatimonadales bacterium]|nr:hypothetical protein [Gemmatimonadales bacterium]
MRLLRLLLRALGWLLTPFVAWAASFFGAVGGAELSGRIDNPIQGLVITAVGGAVAGFAALVVWLRFLRRSPEVRQALGVNPEGAPDTLLPDEEALPDTKEPTR